ncbi:hypothetical protein HKX42_01305 [Salinisphaera sp. USBA-960]|uniref:NAD(+)/NADH kinase n=1 Tax=Salinisphaera orenii TaxID=856731 RepID=UPI000DBE9E75|nr:hypothetical protein [Salifodinibacter halophilus]NNC25514.1 hypothetical protein [Salifodinibacter halophilus]
MTEPFPTVGVIARNSDAATIATRDRVIADLVARGRRVCLDARQPSGNLDNTFSSEPAELAQKSDLVLVLGGDGTLLEASRWLAPADTPVLGINLGRLGFTVDVAPFEVADALDAVFSGRFMRDARTLLQATVVRAENNHDLGEPDEQLIAVNECVVRNRAVARVMDFDTWMDGTFISQHRADGIVIATPTGSTAHALSAGGPVIHPDLGALAMVPICPHTLSDRPIILDANRTVEIVIGGDRRDDALFTRDGEIGADLAPGDRLIIQRAACSLTLIHADGYDYFSILRNKLHWGRGQDTTG